MEMTERQIDRALHVLDWVISRAGDALNRTGSIRGQASQRIREIKNEIPFAWARYLVTEEQSVVTSLYADLEFRKCVLSDASKAENILRGVVEKAANIRIRLRAGNFSMVPEGDPESWFPDYLTQGVPAEEGTRTLRKKNAAA